MSVNACLESIKISAHYTKEHLPEVAAYTAVAVVVAGVAFKYSGALGMLGVLGLTSFIQRKITIKELDSSNARPTQNSEELKNLATLQTIDSLEAVARKEAENALRLANLWENLGELVKEAEESNLGEKIARVSHLIKEGQRQDAELALLQVQIQESFKAVAEFNQEAAEVSKKIEMLERRKRENEASQ
jgi:hypothetical protein